jgi:hypothetical protein
MRMRTLGIVASAAMLASAATGQAIAHHSFAAEFDRDRPVQLDGVVTLFEWVNPHSWIHIDVEKEDGTVEQWKVEGGAPSALLRRGWDRNTLPAGTPITVDGFQAKDGSLRANASDITFPDGRRMFVGSSGIGAPYEDRARDSDRGGR